MNEQENPRLNNKFINRITSAYDLSSSGMGVHLNAVRLLNSGAKITKYCRASLDQFGSNYIVGPDIMSWLRPKNFKDGGFGLKNLPPLADQHKKLLLETEQEYERLDWDVLRYALVGEDNEQFRQSGLPLSEQELPIFFKEALDKGYILGDQNNINKIRVNDSLIRFLNGFYRSGFDFNSKRLKQYYNMTLNKKFRDRLIKAATNKLGCMLAVTDLITYDATQSGTPIPYGFKPEGFDKGWHEAFGKSVPCIGDLYAEAHEVFRTVADPHDPLVVHLFTLQTLPQMAR